MRTTAVEHFGASLDDAVVISKEDLQRARPRARENAHYRLFRRLEEAGDLDQTALQEEVSAEHELFVRFRRRMVRELEGVAAEHEWLDARFGVRGEGWKLERQSLLGEEGRWFDRMELRLDDGTACAVYFDITSFYGGED